MLFTDGFLLIFLLGGITGVMVSILPFDWAVTDSYFIVAHLHYVLNGAVVFPIFGAIYFWAPKFTGKMLDERLGKISFWTMFVGFNLAFFPMHILGFLGMPRRVYTYQSGLGWDSLNLIVSLASGVFALGTLLTLYNVWKSVRHGERAGADPWHADTLEWATSSPPPDYNFAAIPIVESRHPLWDQRPLPVSASGAVEETRSLGKEGAAERATVLTAGLRADPAGRFPIPEESLLPFLLAVGIGVLFVGLLVKVAIIGVLGLVVGIAGLLAWAWRTEEEPS
jgi:cytochrome c oxidase subunit 1/cytochrome c oxidase subunit I+III